jgi:hypothetical protein
MAGTSDSVNDPYRALRRRRPPVYLEDYALAWMARLPRQVQPRALAHKYARIANQLAALWASGHEFDLYLGELLIDRRRKRQGFPKEVAAELRALASFRNAMYTHKAKDPWAEERLSKF